MFLMMKNRSGESEHNGLTEIEENTVKRSGFSKCTKKYHESCDILLQKITYTYGRRIELEMHWIRLTYVSFKKMKKKTEKDVK